MQGGGSHPPVAAPSGPRPNAGNKGVRARVWSRGMGEPRTIVHDGESRVNDARTGAYLLPNTTPVQAEHNNFITAFHSALQNKHSSRSPHAEEGRERESSLTTQKRRVCRWKITLNYRQKTTAVNYAQNTSCKMGNPAGRPGREVVAQLGRFMLISYLMSDVRPHLPSLRKPLLKISSKEAVSWTIATSWGMRVR